MAPFGAWDPPEPLFVSPLAKPPPKLVDPKPPEPKPPKDLLGVMVFMAEAPFVGGKLCDESLDG
jgi:hypothetical protein